MQDDSTKCAAIVEMFRGALALAEKLDDSVLSYLIELAIDEANANLLTGSRQGPMPGRSST